MLPGFSGALLDADLRTVPDLLGGAAGGGAAADPAAFMVEPTDAGLSPPPSPRPPTSYPSSDMRATASASDLLRELEKNDDFLLPAVLDLPIGMLGGGAASPGPAAASPSTPPGVPGEGALTWPAVEFPAIPEDVEMLQAGGHSGASLLPTATAAGPSCHMPIPPPPASLSFYQARPAPQQAQPPPLFMPTPAPAPARQPHAPPAPSLPPGMPVTAGSGSTSRSETPSPTSSADQAPPSHRSTESSGDQRAGGRGRSGKGVTRPASMPNLSWAEGSSGGVRKKAAPRAPRAGSKPRVPRSRSQSDLKGSNSSTALASAAAVVAACPAATDPEQLPHSAFLTPSHMRKGKGGRQPAADPRLDPNMDPKKAARIMANRLSAAKSKLKQKAQRPAGGRQSPGGRPPAERLRAEPQAMDEEPAAPRERHSQQVQAVEQRLAAQHLQGSAQ